MQSQDAGKQEGMKGSLNLTTVLSKGPQLNNSVLKLVGYENIVIVCLSQRYFLGY
jgi:hypothetical protein